MFYHMDLLLWTTCHRASMCFQFAKLKSSWCYCCGRLLSGFFWSLGGMLADEGKESFQYYWFALFFRLGCWDKKRWTFVTEWNLSHCAAMPPLDVPANASTSFINSYITLKTDNITESDQGVWTSCFHGHNLHSDSGTGRGKKETGGGN